MTLMFVKVRMISRKLLLLLVIPLMLVPVYAQESTAEIPGWVKGVANFWAEGNINDNEFAEAITFLIEQRIIKIDSVPVAQQMQSIPDSEKRLLELELNQKDDRIRILEKETEGVGLDNTHLLNSVVEKDAAFEQLVTELKKEKEEFKKYKEDYPLKTGNIGGVLINADTVKNLERKISESDQTIQELENEIGEYQDRNRDKNKVIDELRERIQELENK